MHKYRSFSLLYSPRTDVLVKDDEKPSENVNVFCKCDCKITLQNIKENSDISEEEKVRCLVEVIRKDHKSSTHHKIQQECVSLIANVVSKENAQGIITCKNHILPNYLPLYNV